MGRTEEEAGAEAEPEEVDPSCCANCNCGRGEGSVLLEFKDKGTIPPSSTRHEGLRRSRTSRRDEVDPDGADRESVPSIYKVLVRVFGLQIKNPGPRTLSNLHLCQDCTHILYNIYSLLREFSSVCEDDSLLAPYVREVRPEPETHVVMIDPKDIKRDVSEDEEYGDEAQEGTVPYADADSEEYSEMETQCKFQDFILHLIVMKSTNLTF
jgi:hypothetical protein